MPVTEKTYEQVALEDPEGQWELVCGRLRSKPGMTQEHNDVAGLLMFFLQQQLPLDQFRVRMTSTRTRLPGGDNYIPDVVVFPTALMESLKGTRSLESYDAPLPLVVEVWSPSTGGYDVTDKLAGYKARGDAEIWLIHPYEGTLVAWVRKTDGSYAETRYAGGEVRPAALPGVVIQLQSLFR
jgi:Uma2 family endonuclease